ncbi:ABC transporter ATP-binding protein [Amphibacillus sp. Q70]|uniref:ABC transporter ATP-binding protein n=1 Tax=Amphibacillus sp. Q70 TaxID=3453416 RepID=UPI003F875FB5
MNAIETRYLTKKFGEFTAINDVSLQIKKGEIHAICGENGAGKSTLMNMLFGLLEPTSGEILLNDVKVNFSSPKEAIDHGIGMVHQHFKLIPSLSVYENVLLGEEITNRFGKINNKKEKYNVQQTIDRFSFDLNATDTVGSLSVGAQQRVEIVKMLHRKIDLLILDEPTAVLTPQETDELLDRLVELKETGTTIIIITHKLDEVKKVSDKVTVIRKGEYVGTVNASEVTEQQISRMMVGRDVITVKSDGIVPKNSEAWLELSQLNLISNKGVNILNDINLNIKKGEIVGIAGVEGNGQSELIGILTGMIKKTSGSIIYQGKEIKDMSPSKLRKIGFGLVPEDRYKHGLNINMSIWANMIAGRFDADGVVKHNFLIKNNIERKTESLINKFDIRISDNINNEVSSLSGGNAQKIIMAREINCDPNVVIMSQPTRGVDVGSIEFIHSQILELKKKGKAILLVSSELTEILNLSDRIYVIYKGNIVGERLVSQTNKEDLGMLMLGADGERSQVI